MTPTREQSLEALFAAFPTQDRGDPRSTALAYLMAVDDVEARFVADAVRNFIKGTVERSGHAFLPSTAELAVEARRCAGREHWRQVAQARLKVAQLQARGIEPVDEARREATARMIRQRFHLIAQEG